MRLNLIAVGFLLFSCKDSTRNVVSQTSSDTVVSTDTTLNKSDTLGIGSVPVILSDGHTDTTISFSVDGLSSEGSEINAHYFNDSLVDAQWNIFGESGKIIIHYTFLKDGNIQALEKRYSYKVQMSAIKSPDDIELTDTLSYNLDSTGNFITLKHKQFKDVYPEFKASVPLVHKKNKANL